MHPTNFLDIKTTQNILLYLLTPWSRVLLENLTGSNLIKKFPAFYRAVYEKMRKNMVNRTDHRWRQNACALHAGNLNLQTHARSM